jgi:hypothetical protein
VAKINIIINIDPFFQSENSHPLKDVGCSNDERVQYATRTQTESSL